MGKADKLMKLFFTNPYVFADVFNYWLYDGEARIRPENLREASGNLVSLIDKWEEQENEFLQYLDSAASADLSDTGTELPKTETVERIRDSIMQLVCMDDGDSVYVLLGIEGQRYVDYGMAARTMIYDALQINKQMDAIRTEHQMNNERGSTDGEFLWRYFKTDHLTPVITVVVFLGKDEWDGPRTLRDMYCIKDPVLLENSLDYKMKLIEPNRMNDEDIEKFQTNMREMLLFLRAAGDKKQLYQLADEGKFRDMDPVAAHLLNEITQSNLKLTTQNGKEKIQMCEAIKGIREDGRQEGITQGRATGLNDALQLVRLFISGNDISQIAATMNTDECEVRKHLVTAGLVQE